MDEALVTCAVDLSGRPFFVWKVPLPKAKLGDVRHRAVPRCSSRASCAARSATCTCKLHEGENLHHIIEISFKALARALRDATELDPRVDRRALDQGHAHASEDVGA